VVARTSRARSSDYRSIRPEPRQIAERACRTSGRASGRPFRGVRQSHLRSTTRAASSAFAVQELAHSSCVTHEEAFNVRRLITRFGLDLPQEWRGVLVCGRREVKGKDFSLKTAAVHSDIIVLTAEMTEHSFKLLLNCDMPAGLHIDARHSHAIPNWAVHGAAIL
jgi:hypothetical protein